MKVARALEGLKMPTSLGEVEMRADNHQILQPLYVSTLAKGQKYDVEGTGLGWKHRRSRSTARPTALPTTCKMERPSSDRSHAPDVAPRCYDARARRPSRS